MQNLHLHSYIVGLFLRGKLLLVTKLLSIYQETSSPVLLVSISLLVFDFLTKHIILAIINKGPLNKPNGIVRIVPKIPNTSKILPATLCFLYLFNSTSAIQPRIKARKEVIAIIHT